MPHFQDWFVFVFGLQLLEVSLGEQQQQSVMALPCSHSIVQMCRLNLLETSNEVQFHVAVGSGIQMVYRLGHDCRLLVDLELAALFESPLAGCRCKEDCTVGKTLCFGDLAVLATLVEA